MTQPLHAMDLAGQRLEYRDAGTGPAVVMVHGGNCSADDWDNIIPHLAARFRLILPDGLVHPLDPWRIWIALDHLQIGSAALVGHSAGGRTVREMYRLGPHRVRGIVAIDTNTLGELSLARKLPNERFSAEARALYEKNRAGMERLRPHHRGDYPSQVTIDRRLCAYEREQMTPPQRAATRPPPRVVYTAGEIPPPPATIDDTGKFVTCPAMVIHTGRGKIEPEDVTQDFQARDVEYVLIKEAGHWPWLENPELFLSHVEPFLRRCSA